MTYDEKGYPDVQVTGLERIFDAIGSEDCIPFLGAGVSMAYKFNGASAPGIPGGLELTRALLLGAGLAQPSQFILLDDPSKAANADEWRAARELLNYDLLKAADCFLYQKGNNRAELDKFLCAQLAAVQDPRPIHTVIAQINSIYTVLTTNYDCLFEKACEAYNREVFKHVHEQFNDRTGIWSCSPHLKAKQLILHKMHGCKERARSMIITRADYIRYLANLHDLAKGMPECIRTLLPSSSLLFLGYGLGDWDFLTIWEGIVALYPQGGVEVQSYAVMKSVSAQDRQFLQKRNIEVIECDLTAFAVALARKFDLVIPQLGVPRPKPIAGGGQ